MPKLSTIHEAVTLATLPKRRPAGESKIVCSSKVPAELGERAQTILKHHGTTLNAYLGACLTLLVEDYERAHHEA